MRPQLTNWAARRFRCMLPLGFAARPFALLLLLSLASFAPKYAVAFSNSSDMHGAEPQRPLQARWVFDPAHTTLLWVHVPKAGGSALARLAHTAAQHHGVTVAWCYNHRGESDCSRPEGTLARAADLRAASFGRFSPEADSEATQARGSATAAAVRDKRVKEPQRPAMVFGHGVRVGCGTRWGLRLATRHMYVVMVRHPLDRLFSAYGQTQRDRRSVNHGKSIRQFIDLCNEAAGRTPGGNLEYFLSDRNDIEALKLSLNSHGSGDELDERDRFELASRTLRSNNTIVLINERWEASVGLLAHLGILPGRTSIGGRRISPRRQDRHVHNASPLRGKSLTIMYDDVAALRNCMRFEERLYQVALAKFERQLREMDMANNF
mmetsp:Transcript_33300/g.87286  ORF Transcript_33300/g.87286 Transcript_33300/m.87286 type:complete len:379 (-) Transcript_33300:3866-5002(-)